MTPPTDAGTKRRPWWRSLARSRVAAVYLALLVISHAWIAWKQPDYWGVNAPRDPAGAERTRVLVPAQTASGPDDSSFERLSLLRFKAGVGRPAASNHRLPVVLLHGSPSLGGSDLAPLALELAESGRDVYALDLPGFGRSGQWVPDYSLAANARYALAAMDALDLPKAHMVGWSQGGGSVLFAADIAPERVATVTLLASIGVQEAEGSGSYAFEHAKYAVGWVGIVALPEVVPHFGLLGPRHFRNAFIRNFADSDQRELEPLMRRLKPPTLIIHGRKDFLVPDWCAQMTHDLVPNSRLVMLDSSHMFPLGKPKNRDAMRQAARAMVATFERHDAPGVPALRGSASFIAHTEKVKSELGGVKISHGMEWWLVILAIVVGTLILEDMTLIAVGLLISDGQIDPFVGLAGCFVGIVVGDMFLWGLGRALGRRLLKFRIVSRFLTEKSIERWGDMLDNHMGKAIFLCRCIPGTRMPTYIAAGMLGRKTGQFVFWELVAVCLWAPALLIASALIGPKVLGLFREVFHGPVAIVVALVVLFFVVRAVSAEATYEGRHKNKAGLQRLWRHEFWPAWALHLPVLPVIAWNALRRGPMTFTCPNPGIQTVGGWIGESKSLILRDLVRGENRDAGPGGAGVAHFVYIPEGPAPGVRAAQVVDAVKHDASLAGYPIVLKPDHGRHGHGLFVAQSDEQVRAYFEAMPRAVIAQRSIHQPHEVSIRWARRHDHAGPMNDAPGDVLNITRKRFPVIEGDGVKSLDHLIWDHPRFQMQAPVFLARLGKDAERVPAKGESVSLGLSGDHRQGAMYLDGRDLLTPALAAAIERLAQGFRDAKGGRIDIVVFDLRFTSEEALKQGEGFTVLTVRGSSSVPSEVYLASRSLWWAITALARHWSRLYAIGARRRREGVRPTGLRAMLRAAVPTPGQPAARV